MRLLTSIKSRILFWQTLFSILLASGVAYWYYSLTVHKHYQTLGNTIRRHHQVSMGNILPEYRGKIPKNKKLAKRNQVIKDRLSGTKPPKYARAKTGFYIIWSPEKKIIHQTSSAPHGIPYPKLRVSKPEKSNSLREFHQDFIVATDFDNDGYAISIGICANAHNKRLNKLKVLPIASAVSATVLIFLFNWWVISSQHKPLKVISNRVKKRAEGKNRDSISDGLTPNELGSLANVLDGTFSKLDESFDEQIAFTADSSHEMRTPLNVIQLESKLALSEELSKEELISSLKLCNNSANYMQALTESMLQLAKVDSGRFDIEPEIDDLAEIIEDSVMLITPLAKERNIQISCEVVELLGMVDPHHFKQVIINLLSNAVKYCNENDHVTITGRKNGSFCEISVVDTGPGISEKDTRHLFDRFYRAERSKKTEQGCTGLGLAISKAIITAHQGDITVSSQLGKGTTFTLTVPALESDLL